MIIGDAINCFDLWALGGFEVKYREAGVAGQMIFGFVLKREGEANGMNLLSGVQAIPCRDDQWRNQQRCPEPRLWNSNDANDRDHKHIETYNFK